mmetsp:Transcript_26422/g.76237  ORF Transcript_26422/g.76237 Transcript_26422/m.76237 type:complete len:221 (+) Transcript_26422:419-1081(+)
MPSSSVKQPRLSCLQHQILLSKGQLCTATGSPMVSLQSNCLHPRPTRSQHQVFFWADQDVCQSVKSVSQSKRASPVFEGEQPRPVLAQQNFIFSRDHSHSQFSYPSSQSLVRGATAGGIGSASGAPQPDASTSQASQCEQRSTTEAKASSHAVGSSAPSAAASCWIASPQVVPVPSGAKQATSHAPAGSRVSAAPSASPCPPSQPTPYDAQQNSTCSSVH